MKSEGLEINGPVEGHDRVIGDPSGEGRLWSKSGSLVAEGHYRIFRDGSGWFACDVSRLVTGATVVLEMADGERSPVQISRLALRELPVSASRCGLGKLDFEQRGVDRKGGLSPLGRCDNRHLHQPRRVPRHVKTRNISRLVLPCPHGALPGKSAA